MLPEVPQMAAVVAANELLLSSLQHFISTTHRSRTRRFGNAIIGRRVMPYTARR